VRQSALRCPYFRWAGSMYATCPYRNRPNAPLDAGPRTISPSYEFIVPRACLLGTCACVWPRGSFERERERVTLELAWASRLLRWHIAPYGRQLFIPKQYRRYTKLRLTASGRYMYTRLHRRVSQGSPGPAGGAQDGHAYEISPSRACSSATASAVTPHGVRECR
jgi:hypothetical protein